MDFDYKKYSLERLENWVRDAVTGTEATPQEIYDIIKRAVEEDYYYFKHHTGRCYELLALLNGNGKGHLTCDNDDQSEECKGAWTSFWEEHYYPEEVKDDGMRPWGHSDLEYMIANPTLTEDRISNFPGEQTTSPFLSEDGDVWKNEMTREYNLREAEYYVKRAKLDATYDSMIASGYTMTDDGFWIPPQKDKVVKWRLPVQEIENGDTMENEYFIQLPDDLLEKTGWKENDNLNWVDNGDGTFTIVKITNPLSPDEC